MASWTLYPICSHTFTVNVSRAVMRASCLSSASGNFREKNEFIYFFLILFPTALSFGGGFVHGVLAEDWRLLPRSTSTRLNSGRKKNDF